MHPFSVVPSPFELSLHLLPVGKSRHNLNAFLLCNLRHLPDGTPEGNDPVPIVMHGRRNERKSPLDVFREERYLLLLQGRADGAFRSGQSGISSSRPFVSLIAPDRMWLPTSAAFSITITVEEP